jgi:hypothetical protein
MWLALPGQVLRISLLRSEACSVAGRCVRRLPWIADTRVHAVVAAFQSERKAYEATAGVTGGRRECRGNRMRSQGRAARRRWSARWSQRGSAFGARGRPHRPDVASAAQGWPRSDVCCCCYCPSPCGEGAPKGRTRDGEATPLARRRTETCAPSLNCYSEASTPASPSSHPNPSPTGEGLKAKTLRSCSTSGTRAGASPRGSA